MSATSVSTAVGNEQAGAARVCSQAPHMRLTRRGRIVFALLGAALCVGLVNVASGAVAGDEAYEGELVTYTVAAGDNLWGIASSVSENDQDVRDVVLHIQKINGMSDSTLQVGQQLEVPAGQ